MRLSLAPSAPSALVGRGGSRRCCAPPPTSAETLSPANRRGAFATVSAAPSALSPTAAGAQRGRGTCVVARAQQAQQRPPPRPTPSGRITPGGVGGPPRPDRPYQQGGYQSGQYQQPGGGPYSQQPYEPYGPQTQGGGQSGPPSGPPEGGDKSDGKKDFLNGYAKALIAGAFVCGLGVGVFYDSEVVLSPQNLSSTQLIDRGSPNSDVCMAYGYSSSVFDMKLYVTYNPFNVYVTQPVIKSGCVLRRANVGVLERENLVERKDVDSCKQRMNTFAFTGDLKNAPEVSCVYHSEEAENQYMNMITSGAANGKPPLPSLPKSAP